VLPFKLLCIVLITHNTLLELYFPVGI
jgi:hypothetical protein